MEHIVRALLFCSRKIDFWIAKISLRDSTPKQASITASNIDDMGGTAKDNARVLTWRSMIIARRSRPITWALRIGLFLFALVPGYVYAQNPIVIENAKPGNPKSEWDVVPKSGDPSIVGFATDISYNKGQNVVFKVDTPAATFRGDIYRVGYYGGMGARNMGSFTGNGFNQPNCLTDQVTGLVDCSNWSDSGSWTIPADATSGVYFAKLIRTDTDGASHAFFIVRDDASASDVLFKTSDTTWQAYNDYGGNSLYVGEPAGRAYKVSYNRPIFWRSGTAFGGVSNFFHAEYPMVRWLERNGYDVTYFTSVDAARFGSLIQNHKVFLSVGHDEYWSKQERQNVETARDAGVSLAFFSGNEVFWKTRWEDSYRTLVCYKETHAGQPIDPLDNSPTWIWTGTWRDPRFSPPADGHRPENELTGQIFMVNGIQFNDLAVGPEQGRMRLWRNTSLATLWQDPQASPQILGSSILGFEWDEALDNGFRPRGLIRLSETTAEVPGLLTDYGSSYGPGVATHTLTLYRHGSEALVFGAGTVQWSWGLDSEHDNNPGANVANNPDVRVRQATVNLLADMGVQSETLQNGLTPAVASTDFTPPTSQITSPPNGATVELGSAVTVAGTATDSGGVVGGVEVSVDGGTTWHPAAGLGSWNYQWVPTVLGPRTIMVAAVDDSGNLASPKTITVTVSNSTNSMVRIWNNGVIPAFPAGNGDPNPVELGVKFASDVTGTVTGIRFYKASGSTGNHIGHLWDGGGALLASAIFTNETASGWQYAAFPDPVEINANTTYVASYNTIGYAYDPLYFSTAGVDSPPLHALRDGVDGGNGVYAYGGGSFPIFPSSTYNANNYWVDVDFSPATIEPNHTTIWANSVVPAVASDNDPNPLEVGVKFRVDVDGMITALRFYKGSTNTGPHVGHLWTSNGNLLATAEFVNETAVGWQQVELDQPVAVTANTTYVASYHTESGNYAYNASYFQASGVYSPPLYALQNGEDGGNGVYLYGPSAFPTNTYNANNYWVDVVFTEQPAPGGALALAATQTKTNAKDDKKNAKDDKKKDYEPKQKIKLKYRRDQLKYKEEHESDGDELELKGKKSYLNKGKPITQFGQ